MKITDGETQVIEGDGLPDQICTQCLQMVSRAYSFKQLCEKSDETLRHYVNSISLNAVTIQPQENIMVQTKTPEYFNANEIPQSSLFSDIFNDATTHTLVEEFSAQGAAGISTSAY